MTARRVPVWLDCDPGHDDAFAILLASYHPDLELLGVSTVYGNAPLNKTTKNALSILQAIGMSRMPVHPGVSKPFCREVSHASDIHGESGLDGTDLLPQPERSPLTQCNAIKDMRDALMACPAGTAWLVTSGTLTNAALLFATFPEVASHLKGLSIMGGSIGNGFTSAVLGKDFKDSLGRKQARIGNWTPYAEFNIWCDPEAAQSIFRNAILAPKTTLITLDLTHQAFVNEQVRQLFLASKDDVGSPTKMRQMFDELLMFFTQTYAEVFGLTSGPPLHDPLAVAVLLADVQNHASRIDFDDNGGERFEIEVVQYGEEVGRTKATAVQSGKGITIPRKLDLQRFWKTLADCLDKADEATGYRR